MQVRLRRPWLRSEVEEVLGHFSNPSVRYSAMQDGSAPVVVAGLLDGCRRYHIVLPWWLESWSAQVKQSGIWGLLPAQMPLTRNDLPLADETLRQLQ